VAHHAHHTAPAPTGRGAQHGVAGGGGGGAPTPKGGSSKHHPRRSKKHKKRGLALGEMVACCAAEAVAMSLRLAGQPVSDADVLALYSYTAGGPDDGASIEATLAAASRFGLAGYFPYGPEEYAVGKHAVEIKGHVRHLEEPFTGLVGDDWPDRQPLDTGTLGHGLILGVDLPGAHTVLATDAGWWSWGELHDPAEWPNAIIEEAWAVSWT
jgi:hypothetical protein